MQLLLTAALNGIGIAYGPSFVFGESLRTTSLVQVLPAYRTVSLGIHTLVSSSRHVPTKVRHLIDRLITDFGDEPPWDEWMNRAGPRARKTGSAR